MTNKKEKALIELNHIVKNYGKKDVLKDVNISIGKGKIVGLLGPNGSGKTTIIKLLNDLLVPTEGSVLINGKTPGVDTKKRIAYLPERNSLDLNMKIIDLVCYFKDFFDDFDEKRAMNLLEKLHIQPKEKLKTLSKGNREKVQLILVMSRHAELYILDEPIGGVDPATRDYILDLILSNFDENATILISTHLIADVERILDEVVFISDGKVVLDTTADEIRNQRGLSIDQLFREEFKC